MPALPFRKAFLKNGILLSTQSHFNREYLMSTFRDLNAKKKKWKGKVNALRIILDAFLCGWVIFYCHLKARHFNHCPSTGLITQNHILMWQGLFLQTDSSETALKTSWGSASAWKSLRSQSASTMTISWDTELKSLPRITQKMWVVMIWIQVI